MANPSLSEFETAASAVGNMSASPGGGLRALTVGGKPLTLDTANGAVAEAYVDTAGNVIIAYQGTETRTQLNADLMIAANAPSSSIGAFTDALKFVATVKQAAANAGVDRANVSVTGFSLGGNLAEYVAMKTGLPGMSFAGSGIPNYAAPSSPAQNFISLVETGDPWANRASDAALAPITAGQSHYGRVETIGTQAATSLTTTLLNDVKALLPAFLSGHESQAVGKLVSDYETAFASRHVMSTYFSDSNALPAANVTLANTVLGAAAGTDMRASFAHPAAAPSTAVSMTGGLAGAVSHLESLIASVASTAMSLIRT